MFYVAQIAMALFAFFQGRKEGIYLAQIRQLPYGNLFEKPYHAYGWLAAAVVGVILTLLQSHFKACILTPFLSAFIYWAAYELSLNGPAFGRWDYLGRTAAIDKFLWKTFGVNAERWAIAMKTAGIVFCNLIYLFL